AGSMPTGAINKPTSAMAAINASPALTRLCDLNRAASGGTSKQVTTCSMTEGDTYIPAVTLSSARQPNIAAIHPKTPYATDDCKPIKHETCHARPSCQSRSPGGLMPGPAPPERTLRGSHNSATANAGNAQIANPKRQDSPSSVSGTVKAAAAAAPPHSA